MSSGSPHRTDLDGTRSLGDLSDVMTRREPAAVAAAPAVTATNVVLFARTRRENADTAAGMAFDPASRPAPYRPRREQVALIVGLLALSLLAHAVLYVLFNRAPEPMASIGLEAISVEIVLGANTPAGLATDAGPNTTQSTPADDPDPKPTDVDTADPEPPKPVQTAEAAPPEVAEAKPEEPSEPQPQVAALSVEPEAAAPPEPKPDVAPPEPKVAPRETRPKVEREVKPKPQRADARTRTASREPEATGPRANAASGVGIGRSQADTNYPGLVRAHLARYQHANQTEKGRAIVTFTLDGGGRVASVSLTSSSGTAALDQEAQASVRRASPFPAPPNGRSQSFTVPVTFTFR